MSQRALLSQRLSAFISSVCLAQGSFAAPDISMRGSGAAQTRPRRHWYRRFAPLVGSSAENIRVSDPAWIEGVKVQTRLFFFLGLAPSA